MKNQFLLILACLAFSQSFAQNIQFNRPDPQPDLADVWAGDFASGDIDGDGDQDLLITGISPSKTTELYLNDGLGGFTEVENIPFPLSSGGDIIFSDLDGDGDLDLFFSGNGTSQDFVFLNDFTHVYLNDGLGSFSELANTGLPAANAGRVVIGDLDGDGDQDIIMSMNQVFLNNGSGNFSLAGTIPSADFQYGVMELLDVENDGDLDAVISGEKTDGSVSLALFVNDGTGSYTEDSSSILVQMAADDVDTGDLDGDGDFDILYSGIDTNSNARTMMYLNNGAGSFSQSFPGLLNTFAGTNSIADLDNDGDQDLIIIGSQPGGIPNIYGFIYENTGNGLFDAVDIIGGEYIASNLVNDFTGDGYADIVVQGFVDKTNIYFNTTGVTADQGITGCTNSVACNFNSEATTPDDSCDYSCYGCTDELAANFDIAHTIDDESCVYLIPACPGDFTGDGFINVSDLGGFLGAFGGECE